MNVTIVDYNSGNISSVVNSFKEVPALTPQPKRINTKVPMASDKSSFILLNAIINDVKL